MWLAPNIIDLINYDFLNIASNILFIEIVINLKNTKKIPSQPKIIAIDNKLEPRSRWSKFCMYFKLIVFILL